MVSIMFRPSPPPPAPPPAPVCHVCGTTPARATLEFLGNMGVWECLPCIRNEGSAERVVANPERPTSQMQAHAEVSITPGEGGNASEEV